VELFFGGFAAGIAFVALIAACFVGLAVNDDGRHF